MNILLLEDNEQLAHCLAQELEAEGFNVVTAHTGAEALSRLRQDQHLPTGETGIDVLIIDWDLPDFSGLDVYERLGKQGCRPPALMLTGRDRVEDRVEALNRGFDDYLVKPFSFDELIARIHAISRRRQQVAGPSSNEPNPLSEREKDVLSLIACGLSNGDIAKKLFLSTETIKSHVKSILTKLHAKDRTQALVLALQAGYVTVPDNVD
jgi:DNA-binding NarL/FixJ family response regulator